MHIFLCLHKCAWLLKPSPIGFFHFVGFCRKIGGNWTLPLYVWPSTTRVWAPAKWLEKLGSGSKRWCWSSTLDQAFFNVNQHASMDRLPCCIFICISQGIHGREREHRQTLQSRVFLLVEDRQDVLEFHFHNIKFSCFYVQFMLCTFSFDYMFVMLKIV